MNERIAALLSGPLTEPAARAALRRWRQREWPIGERMEIARRLLALGESRSASLWLFIARRAAPDDAVVTYQLANALRIAGRERVAASLLENLVAAHPVWGEPAQSLAWLHRRANRPAAAAAVLERWARAAGYPVRVVRAVSAFLRDMGLDLRAAELLACTPALREEPGLRVERAELLLRLGNFREAERIFREIATTMPQRIDACVRLAQVRRWKTLEESPSGLIDSSLDRPGLDGGQRAALLFARAKINDDLGRYADAFVAAERANALRAQSTRPDLSFWKGSERAIFQTFTPELFEQMRREPHSPERPVFVVGMPRSGTTLVEQRLARHSALTGGGELDVVEKLARALAGDAEFPRTPELESFERIAWAAGEWRRRLPAGLAAETRIVDKNPLNFFYLGFIALMFPAACIVHCRRDPLDTALSIYFQNFSHPHNDYAYRAADIAAAMGIYRRIMAYWERVLPLPLHVVQYEEMVDSPEKVLREIIAFLGLEWEPACLQAAESGGVIATASAWQARQQVYRHAVGRWHNYAPFIGPLKEALAREGVIEAG